MVVISRTNGALTQMPKLRRMRWKKGMTIVKQEKAFLTAGLDLGNTLQLIFAVLLLILGVLVAIQGVKKLLEKTDDKKATA